jgi:hypothetical protein
MGQVDPDHSTTQTWYESFDPDYLANAMCATDAIMQRLDQLTKKALFAPNVHPTTNFSVLKS